MLVTWNSNLFNYHYMSICEIVLSVNFEIIIALILAIASLFGAPYIVRAQNKKALDKKVELIEFNDLRNIVSSKANIEYVDSKNTDLEKRIIEYKSDTIRQLDKLDKKLDQLINYHLEKK